MFGFLKKKLKDAVKKFSKSAEEDVKEEKVEDKKIIEEAKKKEKIVKKPKPKEPEKKAAPKKEKPEVKEPEKEVEKPEVKPEPKETPKPVLEKKPKPKAPAIKTEPEKAPESKEEPVQEEKPEAVSVTEKKGFLSKIFGKKEEEKVEEVTEKIEEKAPEVEKIEEETPEAPAKEAPASKATEKPEAEGIFTRLKDTFTKKTISDEKFEELFFDLEVAMLENNVAVEVIEKIKEDLQDELTTGKVSRMGIEDLILTRLRESVEELFNVESFDLPSKINKADKPYIICVIGVNGSGKTTSLAKIVKLFKDNNLSCVVAASDTFRAAAIDQLQEHMTNLDTKLISQGYGADPAAVAFDAVEHAKAKKIDVVLIDTAGRLHSNTNLMQELEKVVRVNKPDLKLFVGESITGNDCVEQAKVFDSLVGIDAIILSKADVDEKGGAALSVSYVTGKPILYLGTGQSYEDLEPFDKEKVIAAIGL